MIDWTKANCNEKDGYPNCEGCSLYSECNDELLEVTPEVI